MKMLKNRLDELRSLRETWHIDNTHYTVYAIHSAGRYMLEVSAPNSNSVSTSYAD